MSSPDSNTAISCTDDTEKKDPQSEWESRSEGRDTEHVGKREQRDCLAPGGFPIHSWDKP